MNRAQEIFKNEVKLRYASSDADRLDRELKNAAATANNLVNSLDEMMVDDDEGDLQDQYDAAEEIANYIDEAQQMMRELKRMMR
jgi:methylthioribose-1-phosphate isomerase